MKYLIAGLGNSGTEYDETRHNIGFKVLDELASSSGIFFESGRLAAVAEMRFKGRTLILIKPTTFMNLSGKAVNYWMKEEKISAENTLIVTDDLNLPFGKIRLRGKGSDGGHNGLKNINQVLGHTNYPRLRFGIGDSFNRGKQVDYVLGKWESEELDTMNERVALACDAVKSFAAIGLPRTMNVYNSK